MLRAIMSNGHTVQRACIEFNDQAAMAGEANQTKLTVVGAGPAGMTAAIWARRLGWQPTILERTGHIGGQLTDFSLPIPDLPGSAGISGQELIERLLSQVQSLDIPVEYGVEVEGSEPGHLRLADGGIWPCQRVIYAPGLRVRNLAVPGSHRLTDESVSNILAGADSLTAIVVGGGDRAVEAASRMAEAGWKTCIVHRRSDLRARKSFRERVAASGAKILFDSQVRGIVKRDDGRWQVDIETRPGKRCSLQADVLLIRIGMEPALSNTMQSTVRSAPNRFRLVGDAACPAPYRSLVTAFAGAMIAVKQMVLDADADTDT